MLLAIVCNVSSVAAIGQSEDFPFLSSAFFGLFFASVCCAFCTKHLCFVLNTWRFTIKHNVHLILITAMKESNICRGSNRLQRESFFFSKPVYVFYVFFYSFICLIFSMFSFFVILILKFYFFIFK